MTGTPRVESWPGLPDLPWYELVKPREVIEPQLRQTFAESVSASFDADEKHSELTFYGCRHLSPAGLDVAEALLALDPARRPTADEALQMPYFTTETPAAEMPTMCVREPLSTILCNH